MFFCYFPQGERLFFRILTSSPTVVVSYIVTLYEMEGVRYCETGTSGGVTAGERFDQEKPIQIANCCSGALLWKAGSSVQQT